MVSLQESIWELQARKEKVAEAQQQMVSRVEKEFNQLMSTLLDAENTAVTRVRHAYTPYLEELDRHIAELEAEMRELQTLAKHIASLDLSQSILGTYRGRATNLEEEIEQLSSRLHKPTFLSEERLRTALKRFSNMPSMRLVYDPGVMYQLQQPCHIVVDKSRSPVYTVDPNSWGIRIAPHDIKAAGGHLFMLKRYDNTVYVVDPEPGIWTSFQVDRTLWYNSVYGLAVSKDKLLVSVPDKNCIKLLTKKGEYLNEIVRVLGHGLWHELKRPHGLATTSNNLVIVANTGEY